MDELILRQAAIDATWKEPTYSDPLNVLAEVRDRLKALPPAQPEPRWTPCEKALPKENGEYLVTKIDRITHDRLVDIAHYANFIHDNNGFYKGDAVIAWMPLSKPYRKETDGRTKTDGNNHAN